MFIVAHNGAHVWGGAERAVALLLAGLAARGHRVLLCCNDPMVAERAAALGVPTELQPLGGDVAVHHALQFARMLRRHRPDVLLIGTFKKMWLAALAARLARVPRVVARVGLETDTPRSWKYRAVLGRWVDAVVVNAARMRPAYVALPGWSDGRVTVIYNGVRRPAQSRPPGSVRRELGLGPEVPLVGAVARLARQKRLDRLLDALALLPADVHCLLAGDGEERKGLQAHARALGLGSRVHFLGARTDVGDVLEALDVFVVSSDREGMSNAMLEALAAGTPVVSTPVSGAEEALEPLPDGNPPGEVVDLDPTEIAAAIGRLLGDSERLQAMSAAAARRGRERFSFERMLDGWETVLRGTGTA
ncbi:MAG: glycosyltransferase family 4 protein [Longimicrobiaceae bacterium]